MADYPVDIPAGLNSDDTNYSATPAWVDGSNVRFRLARPQTVGGWESLMSGLLTGVCRAVLAWTDNNSATLNIAFGTHSNLQVWQGGTLVDITPLGPVTLLAANPLTVTNASPTVTVAHTAHPFTTGQSVSLSGALAVGRITPAGVYPVTVVDANSYTINFGSNATTSKTLGAAPLSVLLGSPFVTVTETAHGISAGTNVTISGATAVGGITPNGTFPITVIDANSYQFTFTSSATATAVGGGAAVVAAVPATGGGSNVVEVAQLTLPAGATDGTGTSGYGTGAFGVGAWGLPSAADYFPRTWSLAPWGQKLLASPRNGGLYEWSNVLATKAVAVPTAPAQITQMLVAPQRQVFALGCTQENGTFNPSCLRHSGIADETLWSTDATSSSTAREYVLPGGGRIVGGKFVGRYLLVWTTQSLFLGTYVGQISQVWSFDKVGDKCGLIGPNAAAVLDTVAFWISPDRQFHSYAPGGVVSSIPCPIRKEFADNLAASQADKIVASTIAEFGEVRWDYPDARDGTENSRYLAVCVIRDDAGKWYRGRPQQGVTPARTAMFDAGPASNPIGCTAAGNAYWHERGNSADGQALPWFVTSSDVYLDPNKAMLAREVWPDIEVDQKGPVTLTISTRDYPGSPPTTWPALTITPTSEHIDFKAAGRLFQMTYSGFSLPSYARIGRLMFDAKQRGRRG